MRTTHWLILGLLTVGCGGSEFGSADGPAGSGGSTQDASAGSGGDAGAAGMSGTAGTSGTGGTGGSGGTGTAGQGGSPSCDGKCVPPPPDSWKGPFLMRQSSSADDPAPPCDGEFAQEQGLFHGDLSFDDNCPCACQDANNPVKRAVIRWFDASCAGAPCETFEIENQTCQQLPDAPCGGNPNAVGVEAGGYCEPDGPTDPAPPEWLTETRGCIPNYAESGLCGLPDDLCLPPQPPEGMLCIMQPGDHDCPSGAPYGTRFERFGAWQDNRTCSPCICQPTSEIGHLLPGTSSTCDGPGSTTIPVPMPCSDVLDTFPHFVKFNAQQINEPNCAAVAVPTMDGTVEPTTMTTFCCLQ